jgi:hypothetical protein
VFTGNYQLSTGFKYMIKKVISPEYYEYTTENISVPMNKSLICMGPYYCGCRFDSYIWISHEKKAIYFETPKSASTSIKNAFTIKSPTVRKQLAHLNYRLKIPCALADIIEKKLGTERFNNWIKANHLDIEISYFLKGITSSSYKNRLFLEATKRLANEFLGNDTRIYDNNSLQSFKTLQSIRFFFTPYYGTPDEVVRKYPQYYKFTCLRNPWDRMVSCWKMFTKKRIPDLKHTFQISDHNLSFEEFLDQAFEKRNHHWEPYNKYLPINNNKPDLDLIIEIKNINQGWDIIKQVLDIDTNIKVRNKTDHYYYKEYYRKYYWKKVEKEFYEELNLLPILEDSL